MEDAPDEYMDHIKKDARFIPGGQYEGGFYYQTDKSNLFNFYIVSLGFFDPEGYYFNTEGVDEFGGYYDEEGVYREEFEDDEYADYGGDGGDFFAEGEFAPVPDVLEPGTTFVVRLGGLPYRATEDEVKKALTAKNVVFDKVTLKIEQGRVREVVVEISKEDSANRLFALRRTEFLGRKLFVHPVEYVKPKTALAPAATQNPKSVIAPAVTSNKEEEKKKPAVEKPQAEAPKTEAVKEVKKATKKKVPKPVTSGPAPELISLPSTATTWADLTPEIVSSVKGTVAIGKYVKPPATKPAKKAASKGGKKQQS